MGKWQDEQDDVVLLEPILPKKDCKLEIASAECAQWTVKEVSQGGAPGHAGEHYPAMKLTCTITDENIQIEHEGGRPRLTIEHQFNIVKYPYFDKKTGSVKWMNRQHLYDLEEAFGFTPIFTDGEDRPIEPFVTRTGRKIAPKGEGIKRQLNPDFVSAYFTSDGVPNLEWAGKTVYADIGIEESERYWDRNRIIRFKRAPVHV